MRSNSTRGEKLCFIWQLVLSHTDNTRINSHDINSTVRQKAAISKQNHCQQPLETKKTTVVRSGIVGEDLIDSNSW